MQFKGGGPADIAVIAGEVGISFPNISQAIGYVSSGRLRGLGITSAERAAVLPELPTIAEGGVPGYEFTTWHGILAPKGTPRPIIVQLNEQGTSVLLVEQNAAMALSIAKHGYVMETGKVVKDGSAKELAADRDIQEFYLGVGEAGRRSFRDVKSYRRKKRWSG